MTTFRFLQTVAKKTLRDTLRDIPGGHVLHSSAPLAEELEKVPRGHGNKVTKCRTLLGIDLNPESKKAEIMAGLRAWRLET